MAYRFEWNERKARTNRIKHRVTFDEASSVFDDPLAKIFEDDLHSPEEPREIIAGHSIKRRLLLVISQSGQMREFGSSARDCRRPRNEKLMKKTSKKKIPAGRVDEIKPEYHFDYSKAKTNRFAGRIATDQTVVLLDPEVSKVFTDSESVNTALRTLLAALPKNLKRPAQK